MTEGQATALFYSPTEASAKVGLFIEAIIFFGRPGGLSVPSPRVHAHPSLAVGFPLLSLPQIVYIWNIVLSKMRLSKFWKRVVIRIPFIILLVVAFIFQNKASDEHQTIHELWYHATTSLSNIQDEKQKLDSLIFYQRKLLVPANSNYSSEIKSSITNTNGFETNKKNFVGLTEKIEDELYRKSKTTRNIFNILLISSFAILLFLDFKMS